MTTPARTKYQEQHWLHINTYNKNIIYINRFFHSVHLFFNFIFWIVLHSTNNVCIIYVFAFHPTSGAKENVCAGLSMISGWGIPDDSVDRRTHVTIPIKYPEFRVPWPAVTSSTIIPLPFWLFCWTSRVGKTIRNEFKVTSSSESLVNRGSLNPIKTAGNGSKMEHLLQLQILALLQTDWNRMVRGFWDWRHKSLVNDLVQKEWIGLVYSSRSRKTIAMGCISVVCK